MNQFEKINHIVDEINDFPIILEEESENKVSTLKETLNNVGLAVYSLEYLVDNKVIFNNSDMLSEIGYVPKQYNLKENKIVLIDEDVNVYIATGNPKHFFEELKKNQYFKNLQKVRYDFSDIDENFGLDDRATAQAFSTGKQPFFNEENPARMQLIFDSLYNFPILDLEDEEIIEDLDDEFAFEEDVPNDYFYVNSVGEALEGVGLDIYLDDKQHLVLYDVVGDEELYTTDNIKDLMKEITNSDFNSIEYRRYDFSGIDENFGLDEITTKKAFEIGAMGLGLEKKQKDFLESLPKRINEEIKMEQNKQLTQSEIENLINDKDWGVRMAVAEQGYGLKQLINDESPSVRRAVSEQGYGLEQLVNDKDWGVRSAVAEQGYGLDKLVNDKDWRVRSAVARQEYGLEQLVNDKDSRVRQAVGEQGYGLEQLINDEDSGVRRAVGEQGYGLEQLVNDKDWGVRSAVAEQGYGLDKLINDESWFVRQVVAEQGYGLDQLVNDKEEYVRETVAGQGYGLDKLINDEALSVRRAVAGQGYGLDKLINDEALSVRRAVARQGYGLDKLVNDKESIVREAVAEQGYGLDKLVNDGNEYVRRAVGEQGYGLDKLVNDRSVYVRQAVAEQGYGLDKLVNDEYPSVRRAVAKQLLQPVENQSNELNLENNLKEVVTNDLSYQVDVARYYDPQAWQEKIEDLELNGAEEIARFELDEDVEEFYGTHKNEIENKIDDMSKVLDLDKNSIVNNSDPTTLEYKRNSSVVAYNLTLNEVKKDIEKGSFEIPAMSQNNEEKLVELKNMKNQKMEME